MRDEGGNWITYNGEIYNYLELRQEIGASEFRTTSDTEVVLRAYRKWGPACVERLRGMFAFAIWDEAEGRLFCARDRFGIKPLCYAVVDGTFVCASEAKAIVPFLPAIATDVDALKDYLAFQFCLAGKTLFRGVQELLPGHTRHRPQRRRAHRPLLGGAVRARLRPRRAVVHVAASRARRRVRRLPPALRRAGRAPISRAGSTRASPPRSLRAGSEEISRRSRANSR